jgi:hypothetical protein
VGERKLGSTVPRLTAGPFRGVQVASPRCTMTDAYLLAGPRLPVSSRRRFVPPVWGRRRCRSRAERTAGRERPPFGCPLLRSTPGPPGSLTPQMHFAFVRQNRALSLPSLSAPPCAGCSVTSSASTGERVCQVLPENLVHIGERALAPNLRLKRAPCRHLPTVSQPCASRSSNSFA